MARATPCASHFLSHCDTTQGGWTSTLPRRRWHATRRSARVMPHGCHTRPAPTEARIIPMAASWSVRKISKIVIGLPEPSLAVRRRFGGPR